MVKKSQGYRARTRSLMSKRTRDKGLSSLSTVLIDYQEGDRVNIVIDSAMHKGMPHKRYHGKTGIISGARGRAWLVDVNLGKAVKTLIVRPEHLRPVKK